LVKEEIKFLASILKEPSKIAELNKEVVGKDFSDLTYYDIYNTIISYFSEDKIVTYSDLRYKYRDNLITLDIIDEMQVCEPVNDVSLVYNSMVDNSHICRLKELSQNILSQIEIEQKPLEIINYVEKGILSISSSSNIKIKSVNDVEPSFIKQLTAKVDHYQQNKKFLINLPTGISKLDEITSGLQKRSVWVIGGSTSCGKTQSAVQIVNSLINNGHGVLYCLLEDADEGLIARFLSLRTKIQLFDIFSGKLTEQQLEKIKSELFILKQMNKLFIEDSVSNIDDLVNRIKFAKLKHPYISTVIIDYIGQTFSSRKYSNREQELSFISKYLLSVAKQLDVAILVLAQVNTNPDDRAKGLPIRTNDIRDSKAISHDASVVIFIHHPDQYKSDKNYSKKHTQFIVAKNRYGEVNKIIDMTNKAHIAYFEEGY
jgi:replicative DNA helicase